jgi:hypothetical protein
MVGCYLDSFIAATGWILNGALGGGTSESDALPVSELVPIVWLKAVALSKSTWQGKISALARARKLCLQATGKPLTFPPSQRMVEAVLSRCAMQSILERKGFGAADSIRTALTSMLEINGFGRGSMEGAKLLTKAAAKRKPPTMVKKPVPASLVRRSASSGRTLCVKKHAGDGRHVARFLIFTG